MKVKERINLLKEEMKKKDIDTYIVPTSDYHQSEYISDYFKNREFLTGFKGSAGTFAIVKDGACLWVDGRYHAQVDTDTKDTDIKIFKLGLAGVSNYLDYIFETSVENDVVGFDGQMFSASGILNLKSKLEKKNIVLKDVGDLTVSFWEKRPCLPKERIFVLEDRFSGEKFSSKIAKIREEMKSEGCYYHILSSLDDIAWLLNMRGNDVKNNPVFLSYLLIAENEITLYIEKDKLTPEVVDYLDKENIKRKDYFDIFKDLENLELKQSKESEKKILLDENSVSFSLYDSISCKDMIVFKMNPTKSLKAIKNYIELENSREIHIKDGVAVTKFMYWLKNNYKNQTITELECEDKLKEFRSQIEGFYSLSFDTISAFGANAALMHYRADEESNAIISEGVYLVDSGGQYFKGTTDITRTFILGDVQYEKKKHFTLVLKGLISLSKAKFLYGCTGTNLDILARQFLWNEGIDYKCGTGHGVGQFLNVHEGPHGIRVQYNSYILEENMIVTNEPGAYIVGSHGIRLENELIVKEYVETEHGKFVEFETNTFVPIDLDGVLPELLDERERSALNGYHEEVYEKISPYLSEAEKLWLKDYTNKI